MSGVPAGFSSGRCGDESFMRDEHLFRKGEDAGVGWEGSVWAICKPDSVSASPPGSSEADGPEEGLALGGGG